MLQLRNISGDIRFWIFLFFLVHLYHISNPPLEIAHNWRQTTVTMAARNFVESGPDLLHPRVDFAGEKTGITGMEFPLLNYGIYLVSKLFGYTHWYGRLINLLVSCIGLFYFYRIVQKYFNEGSAFHATLILLFSVWFSYSRKIMPDTFSVSLVMAGLYYGTQFLDRKASVINLLLYALLTLAGVLSKLPAGYLLVVVSVFFLDKHVSSWAKIVFSMASLLMLACVFAWYFYWVPQLNVRFGFSHFFMGKNIIAGARDIMMHPREALEKFYASALGYTGFVLFACSLVWLIRNRKKRALLVSGLCFLLFLVIILKGGFTFYHHAYYIIPFVPVMALICGVALHHAVSRKTAWIALALVGVECVLTYNADFYIKEENWAIVNLEKDLDHLGPRSDKILINSGNVPTPMYFSHRKGWITHNDSLLKQRYLDSLKQKGLKYIVILKRTFGTKLDLERRLVLSNKDYSIYAP